MTLCWEGQGKSWDAIVQAVMGGRAGRVGRLHTDTCTEPTETAGATLHFRDTDFSLMHLPKWLKCVSITSFPLSSPFYSKVMEEPGAGT